VIVATNHVSVTAGDLDRSLHFYRDLLGLEVLFDTDQFPMSQRFGGAVADAVTECHGHSYRFMGLKTPNLVLELVEYIPKGKSAGAGTRGSDAGNVHICLETDDIDGLYETLVKSGVRVHCPPQDMPIPGVRAMYVRDPDDVIIEVLEGTLPFISGSVS
jgi:catechol 2,3-dioxygenase-like lactoylglutathione lyase family enzyme